MAAPPRAGASRVPACRDSLRSRRFLPPKPDAKATAAGAGACGLEMPVLETVRASCRGSWAGCSGKQERAPLPSPPPRVAVRGAERVSEPEWRLLLAQTARARACARARPRASRQAAASGRRGHLPFRLPTAKPTRRDPPEPGRAGRAARSPPTGNFPRDVDVYKYKRCWTTCQSSRARIFL